MQNKGHRRIAAEQKFQDECRLYFSDTHVLHHCVGAKGMHQKTHIGEYFINMVSIEEHAVIHRSGKARKVIEKANFAEMIDGIPHLEEMMPDGMYSLIMDYHL